MLGTITPGMQHSLLCYVSYPIFEIISFDVVSPFNFLSHSFYHRSTKYWNMLNHIRKRTSLIPCLSYFVGMFLSLSLSHMKLKHFVMYFSLLFIVTGTGASGDIFISFLDLKDLYHRTILLISILMQMLTGYTLSLSLSLIRSLCLQCHALSCVVGEPPQPSWKHLRC